MVAEVDVWMDFDAMRTGRLGKYFPAKIMEKVGAGTDGVSGY